MKDDLLFTDGVVVKAWLNDEMIVNQTITLAQLAPYNALTRTSPASAFDYYLYLNYPRLLKANDVLCVGWECLGATDKTGSLITFSTASTANEFSGNHGFNPTVSGQCQWLAVMS